MNNTAEAIEYIHPFTDSGLGSAPFMFVGLWSMPSDSLAEQNPSAHQLAMREMPKAVRDAGCMCEHCYRPLRNFCLIKNAEGKIRVVGTTCVGKTGDATLVTAAQAAERKRQREIRRLKQEAKWQAQREAREAKLQEEMRLNGGATLYEVEQAIRLNEEHDALNKFRNENPEIIEFAHCLDDYAGGFRSDVARQIMQGKLPTGRARSIAIDIVAKQSGRRNSKSYIGEYDRLADLFPE